MDNLIEFPFLQLSDQKDTSRKIPCKLMQTWKTRSVSKKVAEAMTKWRTLNPEYDFYFFSDEDARKYLQEHFGQDVVRAFDEILPGAFKADLFRYAWLSLEGGFFADLDMSPELPINEFAEDVDLVLIYDLQPNGTDTDFIRCGYTHRIYQAFVGCAPGHTLLKQSTALTVQNILESKYGCGPLDITGPDVVGRLFTKLRPDCQMLKNEGEYSTHNGKNVIRNKIDGYEPVSPYSRMWATGFVFKRVKKRKFCMMGAIIVCLLLLFIVLILYKRRNRKNRKNK